MYFPLRFIIVYMISVLMLAQYGPIRYVDFDSISVSFYILMILIAISIGYTLGVKKPLVEPYAWNIRSEAYPQLPFKIVCVVALIGLTISFVTAYLSGSANFDVAAIGETYVDGYKGYEINSGNYSLAFILYSIFLLPNFVTTIWGIYFFKFLTYYWKLATIFVAFVFPLVFTLINGTQKSVGDFLIYFVAIFAIKAFANGNKFSPRVIFGVLITAVVGVILLSNILAQRYKAIGVDAFNIGLFESYHVYMDPANILFKVFGPDSGFSLSVLSGYLTNGLNGLSYALNASNTWSFMLGTSYSISVIGERVFGLPFAYHKTYPHIVGLEYGWGETRWHSVFSWFASDFTFVGTVPLFGFFGYVYARVWRESIDYQNPFSILLFCLLTLGVFMMPANNQLMQTPGGLLTLVVIVFAYFRFRRSFNWLRRDGA